MPNSTCLYPPQGLSLNKAISFPQYLIFSFLEIGYYRLRARSRKAENTHKPIWNSGFQKSGTRTVVRYEGHERLIIWLQALSSPWISRAGAGRFRRAWQRQEKPMERQFGSFYIHFWFSEIWLKYGPGDTIWDFKRPFQPVISGSETCVH